MLKKGCDTQCPKYYQNFAWHELDEDYTVSKRALVTVVCLKKQKTKTFVVLFFKYKLSLRIPAECCIVTVSHFLIMRSGEKQKVFTFSHHLCGIW